MSSSSSIMPSGKPLPFLVNIDAIVSMIQKKNKDKKNNEKTIAFLKELEKNFLKSDSGFLDIMKLKVGSETLFHMAAKCCAITFVRFFIAHAMRSKAGKALLREQLTCLNGTKDGVLIHDLAQGRGSQEAICLGLILEAANHLQIHDYVNYKIKRQDADESIEVKESVALEKKGYAIEAHFESPEVFPDHTPLMVASRVGGLPVVKTLIKHQADMRIIGDEAEEKTAFDLVKLNDENTSIAIMKYFVLKTRHGAWQFSKKHGSRVLPLLVSPLPSIEHTESEQSQAKLNRMTTIDRLIRIDLEMDPVMMLEKIFTYTNEAILNHKLRDAELILANYVDVDFDYILRRKHSDNIKIADFLPRHLIKYQDAAGKSIVQGYFLSCFSLPCAQRLAFEAFTDVIRENPDEALSGYGRLNKSFFKKDERVLLARKIIVALVNLEFHKTSTYEDKASDCSVARVGHFKASKDMARSLLVLIKKRIDGNDIGGAETIEDMISIIERNISVEKAPLLRSFRALALEWLTQLKEVEKLEMKEAPVRSLRCFSH